MQDVALQLLGIHQAVLLIMGWLCYDVVLNAMVYQCDCVLPPVNPMSFFRNGSSLYSFFIFECFKYLFVPFLEVPRLTVFIHSK